MKPISFMDRGEEGRPMTRCRQCGRGTRRPYAAYCDDCRGWNTVPFATEMDEQLRRVYARADYPALGVLAKRWGMPRWRLTHRAQLLGIAATKEPRWSEEEIKILERNCHLTPRIIANKLRARGYRRSESGVVLKRKRLRLRKADRGYSASGLAEVMGVDRGMVLRWIERGLLGAQRLPSERRPGQVAAAGEWFIRPRRVRQFITDHVALVDTRKCDKYWLIDLLTNKRAA